MTTTVKALGGGAQPASIDTSGKVAGGAALRVYGFDSVEAAQAAGYVCEGGPAMSVSLITDAQIASGAWKAEGDPAALVVYTAPSNMPVEGGYALPVYSVNGWGSAAPSGDPIGDGLRTDAKAYYTLNSDGSDATGRGNTASNVGTVTYVAGHIGNAAHFSSVDDAYLSAASSPDLKMTSTDFHIAFWVKLLAKPVGGCGIVTKGESTAFEYGTFYESLDEFGFVADGGDTVFADSLGSPDVGTWYFLEVQWESSTSTPRISVNDAVFDDYGSSAALIPNNDPLIIGGQIDPLNTPNIIDCDIQHIGIWHRFLTQDERDYLYNSGTGRTLYP